MCLSKKSIETLTDLIENKLASMEVFDREDARELACMEKARRELVGLAEAGRGTGKINGKITGKAAGKTAAAGSRGDVIAFPGRPGKRRKAAG